MFTVSDQITSLPIYKYASAANNTLRKIAFPSLSCASFLLVSFTSTAAQAQNSFSMQADVSMHSDEVDYDVSSIENVESQSLALTGVYYLQAVNIESAPIRESAFLSRASNVTVDIERNTIEKPSDRENDINRVTSSVDIHLADSHFRVGGLLAVVDEHFDVALEYDYNAAAFGGYFGWQIQENSLLSFVSWLEGGEYDYSSPFLSDDDVSKHYSTAQYHQVFSFENFHLAVGGGLSLGLDTIENSNGVYTNEDEYVHVARSDEVYVIYYPSQQLGIGAKVNSYSYVYDEELEVIAYAGQVEHDSYTTMAMTLSYDVSNMLGLSAAFGLGSGTLAIYRGRDVDYDLSFFEVAAQFRF